MVRTSPTHPAVAWFVQDDQRVLTVTNLQGHRGQIMPPPPEQRGQTRPGQSFINVRRRRMPVPSGPVHVRSPDWIWDYRVAAIADPGGGPPLRQLVFTSVDPRYQVEPRVPLDAPPNADETRIVFPRRPPMAPVQPMSTSQVPVQQESANHQPAAAALALLA